MNNFKEFMREPTMNIAKMRWLNPRQSLPKPDQLIWGLRVFNRAGKKNGLPSASIIILQVERDEYNVMVLREANTVGLLGTVFYFNEWDHTLPDQHDTHYYGRMITAWMPYVECLPEWDHLNVKESKAMITGSGLYKEAIDKKRTREAVEECTNKNTKFLSMNQYKPTKNGLYVVATHSGVAIAKYDQSTCNPWILPNGEGVFAWYPLPESV